MILLILVFALILRLISLNQSLWLDEAITAQAIKNNSLLDLVSNFSIGDLHPPLHYIMLWFWGRIFGFNEISLRFPSVILGVATVYLTYLIGKELFSKKIGSIASSLVSVAPLLVYYSQEARMYSLSAFTVTLAFYLLIRMTKGKLWSWLGLLIANILILFSDYVAYLVIPAQIIYVFMCPYMEREKINSANGLKDLKKRYFSSLVLAFSTLIFWEPVFLMQLSSGINTAHTLSGWANVVGGANLKELALIPVKTFIGRISFENKLIYTLIIGSLSIIYGYVSWYGIRRFDMTIKLLLLWIIVPIALAFLISIYLPILSYFRMIFILPAFYLLVANGFVYLPQKFFRQAFFALIGVNLVFLVIYYTNPKFQREDWQSMVSWANNSHRSVILENNDIFSPISYYKGSNFQPGLKKVPAKTLDDINDISGNQVYVLQYLVDITDPNRLLEKKLSSEGYQKKDIINFNGVGFLDHFQR